MQALLPVCQAGFTLITDGTRGEGDFWSKTVYEELFCQTTARRYAY